MFKGGGGDRALPNLNKIIHREGSKELYQICKGMSAWV